MVKRAADSNPRKLRQIGLQYDLAHAKGGILDEDEALRKKRETEKKKKPIDCALQNYQKAYHIVKSDKF